VYQHWAIRVAILVGFALAAVYSPPFMGWPFSFDAWTWSSMREIAHPLRIVPIIMAGGIVADCLGGLLGWQVTVRRPLRWALALAVVAVCALWMLRVHHWYGDYEGSIRAASFDNEPLQVVYWAPAEPFGLVLSLQTRAVGIALGLRQSTAMAIESVLWGASAVVAMFLWAHLVAGVRWPLVWAMLLSGATIVLWCGYPEVGTPKSTALIPWYVYATTLALRDRRAPAMAWSSFLLTFATVLHGSFACWLPAHVWYVWRPASWRQRLIGVAAAAVPLAALVLWWVAVQPRWFTRTGNIWVGTMSWVHQYCISNCEYGFWSLAHGTDFLNCLLLLAPVGVLCLPEAVVYARHTVTGRWLTLGAAGWLFLSVVWFPTFGYIKDWDIFAGAPLVVSYLGIWTAWEVMSWKRFCRLAHTWVVVTLAHTWTWWIGWRALAP